MSDYKFMNLEVTFLCTCTEQDYNSSMHSVSFFFTITFLLVAGNGRGSLRGSSWGPFFIF